MTTLAHSEARQPSDSRLSAPGALEFVGADLARHYPGALLLIDAAGRAAAVNRQGEDIAAELNGPQHSYLIALIARTVEAETAQTDYLVHGDSRATVTIELTVIPLMGGEGFLVLGKDITLEKNLRNALVESRKRYKELIECSSDFVWETDGDGRFAFVTSLGALGYAADTLVGRRARSMLDRRKAAPEPFPFEARQAQDRAEVWLRDATGEPACLLVSCVPIVSESGHYLGARGVCRDVTEARRRDEALAKIRVREAMFATMVRTIRDEADPDRMLNTAARVLAEGFSAVTCVIFRADGDGSVREAARCGESPGAAVPGLVGAIEEGVGDIEIDPGDEDLRALACPTRYQGKRNGAIFISRSDRRRWVTDERALLAGVAERVGIAIQQVDARDALIRLSATDSLTGLYNRRAFVEAVEKDMAARRRAETGAALFYIDLNNFKGINDSQGHHRGDAALQAAAEVMRGSVREGELVGRLGGDEFALWIDADGEEAAFARAAQLLEAAGVLADFSVDLPKPLGVSIGIALFDPAHQENVDALMARADEAMYGAKRDTDRHYALAAAPAPAADLATGEQNHGAVG